MATLLSVASSCSVAGQASSAFEVMVTLTSVNSPTGVACSTSLANALVCMQQSTVAGQAGNSEPVVLVYGKGSAEEEGRMWGAVAASRLMHWRGRDYVEMTLTW